MLLDPTRRNTADVGSGSASLDSPYEVLGKTYQRPNFILSLIQRMQQLGISGWIIDTSPWRPGFQA